MSAPPADQSIQVARAIYGQILVTSVVVALSEDKSASAEEILGGVVITTVVFWLAHVYAAAAAAQLGHRHRLHWPEVREITRHEWPIVEAGFPSGAVLALGWMGVFSTDTATTIAIGLGVAGLIGLGFRIGRRAELTPVGTALAVVLGGAFGLAIVALKVFIH